MNNEELRNKCYAFEIKKENRKAIFNHNYLSFIINYSFDFAASKLFADYKV